MTSQRAQKRTKLRDRELLYRLWRMELSHYKGRIVLILLLTALTSALTALYPIVIQKALDLLGQRKPIYLSSIPLWILLITLGKALSQYGQVLSLQALVLRVIFGIQKRLFSVLTDADIAHIEKEAPAKRTSYFTSDIFCIRDLLTRLFNVIGNGVTVVGLVTSMLWMDWSLSLAALILYPIAALPIQFLGKRVRGSAKSVQQKMSDLNEGMTQSFEQAKTIRIYLMEDMEKRHANSLFSSLRQAMMRVIRVKSTIEPFLEILGGLIVAAVLIFIGWRSQMGHGTVGDLTGFVAALLLVAHPLRSLGNLHAVIQEGCGGLERIDHVLNVPCSINSPQQPQDQNVRHANIEFNNVSFTYPDGRKALDKLNFQVKEGHMVALVGMSGAGKSTALSLIPRFYDVTDGDIKLGGEDIRSLSLPFLRKQMAFVGQETSLFDFSIKENIRAGRNDVSDESVYLAARKAGIDNFISSLPRGYDTRVGHQGLSLSGGQRQRIAIARALAGQSKILLLDEVTSALDGKTEKIIQQTLHNLRGQQTIIIAAHRLSTVMKADEIIVMDQGKVAEKGTHASLMKQSGLYANFVENHYFRPLS